MGIGMAVHGGAYAIPQEERERHRVGCRRALERGLEVLTRGGSSLDAVEAAVAALERDGAFDAGRGSVLNVDGNVELDAGIMDGRDLRTGSVAGVMGVPTAIVLARKVLESEYAVLVGSGAKRFAVEHGVATCDPQELVHERERNRWLSAGGRGQASERNALMFGDTVGAVAVDSSGNVAAATATGGIPGKPEGRVGDSPFIGSGLYADTATAAVSTTGQGRTNDPAGMGEGRRRHCRQGHATPTGGRRRARPACADCRARRLDHRGCLRPNRRRVEHSANGLCCARMRC